MTVKIEMRLVIPKGYAVLDGGGRPLVHPHIFPADLPLPDDLVEITIAPPLKPHRCQKCGLEGIDGQLCEECSMASAPTPPPAVTADQIKAAWRASVIDPVRTRDHQDGDGIHEAWRAGVTRAPCGCYLSAGTEQLVRRDPTCGAAHSGHRAEAR